MSLTFGTGPLAPTRAGAFDDGTRIGGHPVYVETWFPADDVRSELLAPSLTRTVCPYKGIASYHTVTAGSTVAEDAAWYYPEPLGEALQVRDMLAVSGEALQVLVDGTRVGA